MRVMKRKISIAALLLAAVLAVSCSTAEEINLPEEEITPPGTPEVSEIDEDDLMFVGIVETAGTAEDFN